MGPDVEEEKVQTEKEIVLDLHSFLTFSALFEIRLTQAAICSGTLK